MVGFFFPGVGIVAGIERFPLYLDLLISSRREGRCQGGSSLWCTSRPNLIAIAICLNSIQITLEPLSLTQEFFDHRPFGGLSFTLRQ